MIIDAFACMLMLGSRINTAKFCSRIISPLSFLKLNLLADFLCGFLVAVLSALSLIPIPLSLYIEIESLRMGVLTGAMFTLAELFVIFALNEGPTGPISAVISFNCVIVSIMTWVISGIALSPIQIVGVLIAFCGVVFVALSKD